MKKIITVLILSTTFLFTHAQENIVKINLFALGLSNISLQYERSLNTHSSVALGFSMLPSRSIPTFGQFETSTPDYDFSKFEISGWSITPEYRYYFSNTGPKGFYVAPYFRYSSYSLDNFIVKYSSLTGGPKDNSSSISGTLNNTLFGLMFGSQWTLGDHWTLDWWIMGAGFGSQTATVSGTGTFSQQNQDDIKSSLAKVDSDVPGVDLTVTTSATNISVEYKSSLPAFRGGGL